MIDCQYYLGTKYAQGARGPHLFDCWGLVRDVLSKNYDVPCEAVPEFGRVPDVKSELTRCKLEVEHLFEESKPQSGAIACYIRKGILFHVGVVIEVDEALLVLHTSKRSGPSLDTISKFEAINTTLYYVYAG